MTHRHSTFKIAPTPILGHFFRLLGSFSSLEVSFSLSALPLNNEELVERENYLERRRHHVQEPITPS